MKQHLNIYLFVTLALLVACNQQPSNKATYLSNGYEYKMHFDKPGTPPLRGQVVTMDYEVLDDFGNVIDDSRVAPVKPAVVVPEERNKEMLSNPLLSLIELLSPGDSADVMVPIDSLPSPPQEFMQSKVITYRVKLLTVEDANDYRKRMHEKRDAKKAEMEALGNRVKKQALTALEKYQSGTLAGRRISKNQGMQVVVVDEGTGPKAEYGDRVFVHYYGFFKDGKSFDNSYKAGRPFSFYIGKGGAIEG
ncbi:MAG: hypothetical protein HKN09_03210, partial [Saprospiraceae bacterium]|nr:hypothetical protein [Saprospiraceae bacterium]